MNLQSKLQKQEAFVSELEANESRIDGIKEKGKELIDMNHYAKDSIQSQLDEIESLWGEVKIKTTEKGKVIVTILCGIDDNSVFYKLFVFKTLFVIFVGSLNLVNQIFRKYLITKKKLKVIFNLQHFFQLIVTPMREKHLIHILWQNCNSATVTL